MLKNLKKSIALISSAALLFSFVPTTLSIPQASAAIKLTAKAAPVITSIANINKTVDIDTLIEMPTTVSAIMSDKTKKNVPVKWDKVLNSDIDGKYIATGKVVGYSKAITYTLIVKAPKMGSITIPKMNDETLKKPTDIKFGIEKGRIGENGNINGINETIISLLWTIDSEEADQYDIRIYDQYKRLVTNGGIVLNEEDIKNKKGSYKLNCDKIKNMNISTITITPVKTTEEGRMTGDPSKNNTGETAIFDCSLKIVAKKIDKAIIANAKPDPNQKDIYNFSFADKISPNKYVEFRAEYTYGYNSRGTYSDKDGKVIIPYINAREYKENYASLKSKLSLQVYSDPIIEGTNKGSFIVTNYPVDYKDNPAKKAAKAIEGVYANGKNKIIISIDGASQKHFQGDLHIINDINSIINISYNSKFDGDKKITDEVYINDNTPAKVEITLDKDTIHWVSQKGTKIEKIDFKRTKDNALKTYESYFNKFFSK